MRWLCFGGVGVGVCVLGLMIVGGAMKEGKGGNVAIDREDFSEEIGGVDEAEEKDKTEKVLAHPQTLMCSLGSRRVEISTWLSRDYVRKQISNIIANNVMKCDSKCHSMAMKNLVPRP